MGLKPGIAHMGSGSQITQKWPWSRDQGPPKAAQMRLGPMIFLSRLRSRITQTIWNPIPSGWEWNPRWSDLSYYPRSSDRDWNPERTCMDRHLDRLYGTTWSRLGPQTAWLRLRIQISWSRSRPLTTWSKLRPQTAWSRPRPLIAWSRLGSGDETMGCSDAAGILDPSV